MKSGERLVWAAAFAQAIGQINWENSTTTELQEKAGEAVGRAYLAVTAMRRLGTGPDSKKLVPAMTMLREMTDPPETNN
jgi:hypothetical protein